MSVVNLSPGRPYDLRAAVAVGRPQEAAISFPGVKVGDEVAFVLGVNVRTSATTVRTEEATIIAPGKVQFSTDTSSERLHIVVFTPNP